MTKMTNAVALTYVLTNCEMPDDVREKVAKMLEQVEKKSHASGEAKPTATQVENAGYKASILESLEGAMTISEMIKAVPALAELSNQRVSAIVRQMVSDGLLVREEIKRKAYFSKVEG